MKRILLVGLGIMGWVAMNAQTTVENNTTFIPAEFTLDSKARLVVYDDFNVENLTADVYNSSLAKETSFNVKCDKYVSVQVTSKEEIALLSDTKEEIMDPDIQWVPTKEELIEQADSTYSSGSSTFYIMRYYNDWKYGKKYPEELYRIEGESVYSITNYYEERYSGNWITTSNSYYYVRPLYISFEDLDSNPHHYQRTGMYFSQTLFNDDEKYEYVFPMHTLIEDKEEIDRDGNGEIDKIITDCHPVFKGFNIISEDGDIVSSFTFTNTTEYFAKDGLDFILWDGKTYIRVNRYSEEDQCEYTDYYLFDKASNQITRTASSNLMRLTPAVAKKSSTVTVELNEETRKNGGELIVNDMSGRRVYSRYVHAGETSVQIPAFRLSSGIFVVSFNNDGKKMETSKLIVQ